MSQKTVLITGCSQGGLGAAMAKAYLTHGFRVFAGLRNTTKAGSLGEMKGVTIIQLEVTSATSIQDCVQVVEKLTSGRLDMLVNSAGITGGAVPMLDASLDRAKQIYDVNVWAVLAISQAFAPMLIKAGGTICNINSVSADMTMAWSGLYNSSKAAMKVLSDTLRLELSPLGVGVVTVMLGGVSTNINDASQIEDLVLPENSYYGKIWDVINRHQKVEQFPNKQHVAVAAANIVRDTIRGHADFIRRGQGSTMAWLCDVLLSRGTVTALMNRGSGLDRLIQQR